MLLRHPSSKKLWSCWKANRGRGVGDGSPLSAGVAELVDAKLYGSEQRIRYDEIRGATIPGTISYRAGSTPAPPPLLMEE